ncbi:MAG TPA: hypothetical protein VE844_21800 [Gammaproteobacteria bacterium]|nr:hypothetical protein [Gammaproteobacteria bacterium]
MASPSLIRWGGLAALLAGAFFIVEALAVPFIGDVHWAFHALDFPAHAFLAVGLVGLYLWQKRQERFGWLGTIGVILIVTASVLIALGGLAIVIVDGVLKAPEEALNEVVHPLELLVIIGAVLFGMATMQMNVLPSGGAQLIIVGALGFFGISFAGVGPEWLISVAVAVLGVGWAWLGYALLLKIGRSAQQPKRVR